MSSDPISPPSLSTRRLKASVALSSLEAHRNLISSCISTWQELELSLSAAENALEQKFKELSDRETEFDAKTQEALAALDRREAAVSSREEASLARVKEQKDSAIASILEEKKKLEEERARKKDGEITDLCLDQNASLDDGKDREEKKSEKTDLSIGTEKELQGKETGSGSVADAATTEKGPPGKGVPKVPVEKTILQGKDEFLKKKRKDKQSVNQVSVKRPKEEPIANKIDSNDAHSLEQDINQVKEANDSPIGSQMKSFVEKMDGKGLLDLLAENTKDIPNCGSELRSALQSSADPCHLVLKAFQGHEDVQKASFTIKASQASIFLLEKLSEIIADPILGAIHPVVPDDARELAKMVAKNLKSKPELSRRDDYNSAHLFLQFLATFGLGNEYKAEDLLDYIVPLSQRGTGPALCQALGLTEKIPALVEKLIRERKQLEAIAFASSFGIMDKIDPGNLLRSYLKDAERAAQSLVEKARSKASGLNDSHLKQVSALKHAMKTIEEYNLNSFISPEDLKKQIAVLEEKKTQRKKATSALKERKISRHVQGSNSFNAGIGLDTSGVKSGKNVSAERSKYMPTDFRTSIGLDYVPADFRQSFHSYRPLNQYDYDRRHESFSRLNPVSHLNPYVREASGPPIYPGISGSNANYLHDNGLPPSNYLPFYRR